VAVAVAACGDAGPVIAPVVDLPVAGSEADPFVALDTLELAVALAGDDDDLASARFERGDAVELGGVPYTDNLVVHLTGALGDVEVAYGRTCEFDVRRGEPVAAPHLFFARTVKWADVAAPPSAARTGGWAIPAVDGGAIFGGGAGASTVDVFSAVAGAFTIAGATLPRDGGVAARLGDGRVVIAGGARPGDQAPLGAVELVGGGRIEIVDDAAGLLDRTGAAAATLADGGVLVVGGRDAAGRSGAIIEVRAEAAAVALRRIRADLARPRAGHTATRLSDDLGAAVLVAGGTGDDGMPVAAAEIYRPLRESLSPVAPLMIVARSGHLAIRMPDGSVLVLGGVDGAGGAVRRLELFSSEGGFTDVGELPPGAGLVDAAVTALPDGRVLLAGGREQPAGPALDTAFIARLDPLDGSVDVVATDRMTRPRAGHQMAALCDGTVLVVGGAGADAPAERYNPPPLGRR
jgi:hypothetical protein